MCEKRLGSKGWVYIGAWGVISKEKMDNGLKLLFGVVSERSSTIGANVQVLLHIGSSVRLGIT